MTAIKHIDLDLLSTSALRPERASIPVPPPHQIELAELAGLDALPMVKARHKGQGDYEIITGIITWRIAHHFLGMSSMDVEIIDIDDAVAQQLVNEDYKSPHSIDSLAMGEFIVRYSKEKNLSYTKVGGLLGMKRRMASMCVRINSLAPEVKHQIREGLLLPGLAKCLVTLPFSLQRQLANQAIKDKWSARAMEQAVKKHKAGGSHKSGGGNKNLFEVSSEKYALFEDKENNLAELLGAQVDVFHSKKGGSGSMVIQYHSLDEYDGIVARMRQPPSSTVIEQKFPDDFDDDDFAI